MEIVLVRQTTTQIHVLCNNHPSHTFNLRSLVSDAYKDMQLIDSTLIAYGKAIYNALFPPNTQSQRLLACLPERILLVTTDDELDSIGWEYAYGPEGFLALEYPFVRGLPADQRIPPPTLDAGLHIVAIPSNPLHSQLPPLQIENEWIRLKETVEDVPCAWTLERTFPATLEQVRRLVIGHRNCIIHFMGHGGVQKTGAALYFEKDNGDLDIVDAKRFIQRVHNNAFLILLNACVSAIPGTTTFDNLALTLAKQKIPYTLGMRWNIQDTDARLFSKIFYDNLARGTSVEEALFQARLALVEQSPCQWVIGVPILYTSLATPAPGFVSIEGSPFIEEHQPKIEINALPLVEGTFQGRIEDLKWLGRYLAGDSRKRIVTIHGGGGQGKTALARKAVERFAYAWPGGIWGFSLEHLCDKATFVTSLARFLEIATQEIFDIQVAEHSILTCLSHQRTLIVIDNMETLLENLSQNNPQAIELAQFIKKLPNSYVSLLVTSRSHLQWPGETLHEIEGLLPEEGARLFIQHAPQRASEISLDQAIKLSEYLGGHPLGIRLLAGAFNEIDLSLHAFLVEHEKRLLETEDLYVAIEHRHRTIKACLETNVYYLDEKSRALLDGLRVFSAPFRAETVVAVFDPDSDDTESAPSAIRHSLHLLWQRGLLLRQVITARSEVLCFYSLLHVMRPYLEYIVGHVYEQELLHQRLSTEYSHLVKLLHLALDKNSTAVIIALQSWDDIDQAGEYLQGVEQGRYLFHWAWIVHRLGNPPQALKLLEQAIEIVQGQDQKLELQLYNNIAMVYQATGQLPQALVFFEQALPIMQATDDQEGKAATLNNMATVYQAQGNVQKALELYEQSLSLVLARGDIGKQAATSNNIARLYQMTGRPQEALQLLNNLLPLVRSHKNYRVEAIILNSIAIVYQGLGQFQEAIRFYQEALPIRKEMGDRAGEATTLAGVALIYQDMGQPQRALTLLEEALPIFRATGNRASEVATLNDIAVVYRHIGQLQKALQIFQEVLPLRRELGDRAGEATTLHNIAETYLNTGFPQEALGLSEKALIIRREIGDRAGEADTLSSMALGYHRIGRLSDSTALYEEALLIMKAVGHRRGEVTTLHNLATLYTETGRLQDALSLFNKILLMCQEMGDLGGEATTLTNIAGVYLAMGHIQQALKLYIQALAIHRETENCAFEAETLNAIALIYETLQFPQEALLFFEQALPLARSMSNRQLEGTILGNLAALYQHLKQYQQALELYGQALTIHREIHDHIGQARLLGNLAALRESIGQTHQALELLEQALPITREVGSRANEAGILSSMAALYQTLRQPQKSLRLLEQALVIRREIGDDLGEATVLENMAVLYHSLKRFQEAIIQMEQAITLLKETGSSRDLTGRTVNDLYILLHAMYAEGSETPIPMSNTLIEEIISGVVFVMTRRREQRESLYESITVALREAQEAGSKRQLDTDFFAALLEILDGRSPNLPDDHPYALALTTMNQSIASGNILTNEPFEVNEETTSEEKFIYQFLIDQTLAVLSSHDERKTTWSKALSQMRETATLAEDYEFAALLDAILGLLDTGDTSGLGLGLTNPYKRVWETIGLYCEKKANLSE